MNTARTVAAFLFALFVGLIGYWIGVSQNVAAQIPAGTAPMAYWYPWHFGFGFLGLLFPLLFFFLIFGLVRAAFWGGPYRHGAWSDRRAHLEELHRELHQRDQAGGGPART